MANQFLAVSWRFASFTCKSCRPLSKRGSSIVEPRRQLEHFPPIRIKLLAGVRMERMIGVFAPSRNDSHVCGKPPGIIG